ncbi:MAG: PAS domain S-box protein [Candidatus Xenobiia bacterium LiM19]
MDSSGKYTQWVKRILLVEDNSDHGLLIKTRLKKLDESFQLFIVETGEEALQFLEKNTIDLILSDYELPGMNGIEMLQKLRNKGVDIPCVFLTAQGSEQIAIEALRAGASDYFNKEEGLARYERLVNSINKAINKVFLERELTDYRSFLETVIDTIPEPVFIKDTTHRWVIVNKSLCDFLGYRKEDMLWRSDYDLFPKEEADFFWQKDDEVFASGKRIEIPEELITDSAGRTHYLNTIKAPLRNNLGELTHLVGSIRDITMQKYFQERLRKSEAQYRLIFENSPETIVLLDCEGKIVEINRKGPELLGYTVEELIGRRLSELPQLNPVERVKAVDYFNATMRGDDVPPYELTFTNSQGQALIGYVMGTPVFDDSGKLIGDLVLISDITERKKVEEELRRNEQRRGIQNRNIPIPTYTWQIRDDGIFLVDYNDAAYVLTMASIKDILGHEAGELHRDRPDIINDLRRCRDEKSRFARKMLYSFKPLGDSKLMIVYYAFVPEDLIMVFTQDITELEETARALRESESKYSTLVEKAIDGVIIAQNDLLVFANYAMEAISGYSRAELIGMQSSLLLSPSLHEIIDFSASDEKASSIHETTLHCRDGSEKIIELTCGVIELQEKTACMAFLRDVTERRKTEQQLQDVSWKMEFILGATKTCLDIIDEDKNVVYVDPEWKKLYGDYHGRKCYEYFKGRSSICSECGAVKALETKSITVTEGILVKEGGRHVQITSMPFQDMSGKWLVAEVNVDISRSKTAEMEARKLVSLVENSKELIGMADLNGKVFYINEAGKRLVGIDKAEDLSKLQINDFVSESIKDHLLNVVMPSVKSKGYWEGEGTIQHLKTGRQIDMHITTFLVNDAERQEPICFATIMMNISDLKRSEGELKVRNRELESFVYAVSHDLKTPLMSIREYSDILLKDLDGKVSGDAQYVIERMLINANKAMDMIAALQNYARYSLKEGDFRRLNIKEVIQDALADLSVTKEFKDTAFLIAEDWPEVMGDKVVLYQVFLNLFSNAIKFGAGRVEACWENGEGLYRISVRDDGVGVEDEFRDKIFDVFTRAPSVAEKTEGAGIGLAIVRKAVESHGGKIWVENRPGGGSCFCFTIPVPL